MNHPNIVKMWDAVNENGKHYLIMEYVSGSDLSRLLKNGQISLEQVVNIAIDLADALTHAHRLQIIHRDLKPANMLIGEDGILRLTDFGVAHIGSKERVTGTNAIIGTIDYLPPEAFEGGQYDERGEIWAFGVILFEMLAGNRPFEGDTMIQVIQAIATATIPDLEELRPDVPVDLVDLIHRMLERDTMTRISSVRHVGAVLADIQKAEARADELEMAYCFEKLGDLTHNVQQDDQQAVDYFERATSIYRKLGEMYYLTETMMKLSEAYQGLGNYQKSVPLVHEAQAIQEANQNKLGLARHGESCHRIC